MQRKLRATLAAAAAVAIASLGIGGSVAFAAPNPAPVGPESIIDPNAGVQLNIHKYLGAPLVPQTYGDGTVQTVTGLPAVSGVTFDVYRVSPVDLTTNAGWTAAAAIAPYQVTQANIAAGSFTVGTTTYTLTAATTPTVTTGTGGLATFNQDGPNAVGLYLVNENLKTSTPLSCPTPTTCTAIPVSQVSPSRPFFVTLPMTNPTTLNTWMYEVNAYPKNQQDTATKTVADQGTSTSEGTGRGGDHTILFTLTTDITDGLTAAQMNRYVITDILDSRLAPYTDPTNPAVVTVGIDEDGVPGGTVTPLVLTDDYTITGNVVITMTPAGLAKLVTANTANAAAKVVTTIEATVMTEGTGTISNQAYVIPNQAWYDANLANCPTCDPGVPTNATPTNPEGTPTLTKYGDLRLTKVAVPAAAASAMAGAEFAVYLDATPTTACTAADVTTGATNPIIATGTTDSAGLLTIQGLQTSDFYNGATQTDLLQYCLVETKAPVGYNLNPQAVQFTILQATAIADDPATAAVNEAAPAFQAVTVNNELKNLGNNLPLTGGEGVAALSAGGLLLVGGGLAYYLVTSRRRREERS